MVDPDEEKQCADCDEFLARYADFRPRFESCLKHRRLPKARKARVTKRCKACQEFRNGRLRQPRCTECDGWRSKRVRRTNKMKEFVATAGLPDSAITTRNASRGIIIHDAASLSEELVDELYVLGGNLVPLCEGIGLPADLVEVGGQLSLFSGDMLLSA